MLVYSLYFIINNNNIMLNIHNDPNCINSVDCIVYLKDVIHFTYSNIRRRHDMFDKNLPRTSDGYLIGSDLVPEFTSNCPCGVCIR